MSLLAPASSPVMLSTSTCHLCSSCSSCRISRFWRRSATVSSGVRWGVSSAVTGTLYWSFLFQQELPPSHHSHQDALTMFQDFISHVPGGREEKDESGSNSSLPAVTIRYYLVL